MVGSDFDEDTCRSGFDFDGKFVRVGSPRSDVLFQEGVRERVYDKLGIEQNKHTVLFAPTFRAINNNSLIGHMREVDLDFELVKATFERVFGGEWIILLRIHPDVAMESKKVKMSKDVYDVSQYPNSQELVASCDAMISDYSSIMFEPAFVGKPVFLFAPDVENYVKNDRELLIDYYDLPFSIAITNEELKNNISSFDAMDYKRRVTEFLNKYGVHEDGHASERAADFILSVL
jgi:CDP-glycerol glycerophosphotransferase